MADSDHPDDYSESETAMSAGGDSSPADPHPAARKPVITRASPTVSGIAEKVANCTKEEAWARVIALTEQSERTYFELGGLLAQIQKNKWYEPEGSFARYVAENLRVSY